MHALSSQPLTHSVLGKGGGADEVLREIAVNQKEIAGNEYGNTGGCFQGLVIRHFPKLVTGE